MYLYESTTGKSATVVLRPGQTPASAPDETSSGLYNRMAQRSGWCRATSCMPITPAGRISIPRGAPRYGRRGAMIWCERNRVSYVFGLAGNKTLHGRATGLAVDVARAGCGEAEKVRRFGEFRYAACSCKAEWWVVARIDLARGAAAQASISIRLMALPPNEQNAIAIDIATTLRHFVAAGRRLHDRFQKLNMADSVYNHA